MFLIGGAPTTWVTLRKYIFHNTGRSPKTSVGIIWSILHRRHKLSGPIRNIH
uniref:Uncharacterized protein n=1 Tax=Anguilla anguilla TaxID=7936 RepID=A0A0E9XY23_ANGAN